MFLYFMGKFDKKLFQYIDFGTESFWYCRWLKGFATPKLLEQISVFQGIAWLLLATSPAFIALGIHKPTLLHMDNSVY